jgi:ATP-dependent DNA ligase
MLSKRVEEIPSGGGWIFEPKWDGFRALVFRDGDEVVIQSRDSKPLNRYFPELIEPIKSQLPAQCAVDGEVVIEHNGALDFEALQLRIHPAASRINMLAKKMPASMVIFDLICEDVRDWRGEQFGLRRARLEYILGNLKAPLHLTPATEDTGVAADWFRRFEGAGFDGVMAKRIEGVYESDKRVMLKVKHDRDCDCVVAGFRWYKQGEQSQVGSLLLGLYDDSGILHHVGVCASFTAEKRHELVEFLAPYRENAAAGHPWNAGDEGQRLPGGQSRWSRGKDLSWEALRPELVVEVTYEHMQGTRFRHMAHFRRWRTDKRPQDCTYAQLEVVPPQELRGIFAHP